MMSWLIHLCMMTRNFEQLWRTVITLDRPIASMKLGHFTAETWIYQDMLPTNMDTKCWQNRELRTCFLTRLPCSQRWNCFIFRDHVNRIMVFFWRQLDSPTQRASVELAKKFWSFGMLFQVFQTIASNCCCILQTGVRTLSKITRNWWTSWEVKLTLSSACGLPTLHAKFCRIFWEHVGLGQSPDALGPDITVNILYQRYTGCCWIYSASDPTNGIFRLQRSS